MLKEDLLARGAVCEGDEDWPGVQNLRNLSKRGFNGGSTDSSHHSLLPQALMRDYDMPLGMLRVLRMPEACQLGGDLLSPVDKQEWSKLHGVTCCTIQSSMKMHIIASQAHMRFWTPNLGMLQAFC